MKPLPYNHYIPYGLVVDPQPDNAYPIPDALLYAAFLAVNNDRTAVGLEPLQYDDYTAELGFRGNINNLLRGAKNYWTKAKRSEAVEDQLRHPETGEWVPERANLGKPDGRDLHRSARARTDKAATDDLRLPGEVRGEWKLGPPPPSSPKAKVTRLKGPDAVKELIAAGHAPDRIGRWKDRGVVFRVEHPGENPLHVFVANPDAMTKFRSTAQQNDVRLARTAAARFQAQFAAQLKAGDPRAIKQMEILQRDLTRKERALANRLRQANLLYGKGGDETIGKMEEALASEAGALFLRTTKDWPEWALKKGDGTRKPFMIEFDQSKLINGDQDDNNPAANIMDVVPGRATDQDIINLDKRAFRDKLGPKTKNWLMSSDLETWGQHAMAHEPGHLLDDRQRKWDSNKTMFDSYIAESRKHVDAAYLNDAARPNREWYAEMHALAEQGKLTPQQRVAVQAYLSMFMLQRAARPANPTTAWVAAHEQWLTKAIAAVNAGQRPPALPDPTEFFQVEKPKIQKRKGWNTPW